MRHRNTVKKLHRKAGPRRALLRDLATSVIVYEKVKMTEGKARAVRPIVERIITKAKKGDLTARRQLLAYISTPQPVEKLMDVLGPRYKDRNGGYTRLVKIGHRQGDAADMVQIELV